jgi:mannose/fructose/N-acetylgalactosamine-specific phosphotransferase system component IIC
VTPATLGVLVGWGVITGIDLVSVLQSMVARPLVAGTVAGAIVGDPATGVLVGMVLELFALEVLPVGGARIPDYGPAAVAATAAGAGAAPGELGAALVVGLAIAHAGEASIRVLRRWNTHRVHARAAMLDAGDARALERAQMGGIARDALRALLLTVAGLALAWVVRAWQPLPPRGSVLLTAVLAGIGLATATMNGKRLASGRSGYLWLTLGLGGGIAWLLLA